MLDYVSANTLCDKDTPYFGDCKKVATYANLEHYVLKGCEKLDIWWWVDSRMLRIEGSLAYYIQGHNFAFGRADFVEAVEFLQRIFRVDLWGARVGAYEYGVIVDVPFRPKEYIRRHSAKAGTGLVQEEKGRDKGAFRWWENKVLAIKMYDAKKNIQRKQRLGRRVEIEEAGYNPDAEYLKFETHIKNPESLNGGRVLTMEELVTPNHIETMKHLLMEEYAMLKPQRSLELPASKKDLSTADIGFRLFTENLMQQEGITPQEAKKEAFRRIDSIPEGILSKADKDARKRQMRGIYDRIKESPSSQWDLSQKIADALDGEKV